MDELKKKLRQELVGMLIMLDDVNYETEVDRFGEIAESAGHIREWISDCEAIDWQAVG